MILHLLLIPNQETENFACRNNFVTFTSFHEDTNLLGGYFYSPSRKSVRWDIFPRLAPYKDRAKYPNYDLVQKNSGDFRPYHGR